MFEHNLFNELYGNYCKRVYAIIYNIIKDEDLSKDALQQTFIKVYRNLQKFRGMEIDEAGPLIAAIARNTAIDFYRKHHKLATREVYIECGTTMEFSSNALDEMIQQQDFEGLQKYFTFLDEEEQDLLLLKYYYGFTLREIATLLEVSTTAATSRLYRLKQKIARLIAKGVLDDEKGK